MSIKAFQESCKNHEISTSFHVIEIKNVIPACKDTKNMSINFWAYNGLNFSQDLTEKNGTIIFEPKTGHLTYPSAAQLSELDRRVQDCISNLWTCLKEQLPITEQKIRNILGDTVVQLSSES